MTAREALDRHCANVLAGKMDEVGDDLTPEVAAGIGPVVEKLGEVKPTSFRVLEDKPGNVFVYEYVGPTSSLKLQSTWEERNGKWMVTTAQII